MLCLFRVGWACFPQAQLSFVWQKNRSLGPRVSRNRGHVVHSNAGNALQWLERGGMTLTWSCCTHRSTSVQVANCLFLGSGWAVELLHRTFFCPGIDRCSALEFYPLRATDRARTERELVERGGRARKQGNVLEGMGRGVKQNSFQSASLEQAKKFPIDIHFLALDRFCVRSFLYCLQNAH